MAESSPTDHTVPRPIEEWVRANPLPTQLLDQDGQPLLANAAYTELLIQLHRTSDELLAELLPPGEEIPRVPREYLPTLRPGDCLVRQLWLERNKPYTFHLIKLALTDRSCVCCMLMPGDNPAENRFTGILNAIACFVLEFDARGNLSYINDPLREHLGYAPRDLRRLEHLRQLLHGFRSSELERRLEEVSERGRVHFRDQLIRRDGTASPMEMSIVASQTPNESLYLLTARDIGAQLAHETTLTAALAASERQTEASESKIRDLRRRLDHREGDGHLVYQSEAFAAVVRHIHQLAELNIPVLITGEPGSGKRRIARYLHERSPRADRPFVTVDCAALPPALVGRELFGDPNTPGGLRAGAGGTLLLCAVDALAPPVQTQLARVLQAGEFSAGDGAGFVTVDVRVLCTTTRDLKALVDAGNFKADLFYRLGAAQVATIPLRERQEDVHPLIGHFIVRFNRRFGKEISGVDETTLQRLEAYSFPGNVRELEALVERAFVTASEGLLPLILPATDGTGEEKLPVLDLFNGTLTEFVSFEEYQRKYIQLVVDNTGGKVSGPGGAAEILQMHPQTLFSKLRKLGIRR